MRFQPATAILTTLFARVAFCQDESSNGNPFDTIVPSANLNWHPCYEGLRCSKLEVPIDHANKSLGNTHIAWVQRPGKNATDDSPSIILIPGGPGDSGNRLITLTQERIGVLFQEQYNVVSFDPRGVGDSGLTIDCFMGNDTARKAYARLHNTATFDLSGNLLQEQFYSSAIYADWCDEAIAKEYPYANYVTTPASVRDMLAFLEAEAVSYGRSAAEAKLWAYGISYGTVVGTTFASMFPDRIERLVLDGVKTAQQHYDNIWTDMVDQGDDGIEEFANLCHSAGIDKCAFWGPSPGNILQRLDILIEQLRSHPMPVSKVSSTGLPTMVTYSDIKTLLLDSVYNPLDSFPIMAEALHQLELGNASALATWSQYRTDPSGADKSTHIVCGDSYKRNKIATLDDFRAMLNEMTSISKYLGDVVAISVNGIVCNALDPKLPDSMLTHGPISGLDNPTAFPILFTTNTIDPITPLKSAYIMSSLFKGSVVLRQEAVGHTVVDLGGSDCYFEHVLKYFAGVVPEANITCPPQYIPFIDSLPV